MLTALISLALNFYAGLIFVYILMSWIPTPQGFVGEIYRVLGSLCEPYLSIFRKVIPPLGGIDFSPVLAIIVIEVVQRLVVVLL